MKISFVVPTFNAERTLKDCLDSIFAECIAGDEVIVVDNGSTDKSVEIAKSYNDLVVYVKSDCHVSAVRNFGVDKSAGQLIAFIDSDCVLVDGWRKNALLQLAAENIGATGCKYQVPPDSDNWLEKVWFAQRVEGVQEVEYINSGNLVVKRSAHSEIGGFDEELETGEDSEYCYRLRAAGYVILSDEKVGAIHLGNPKTITGFYGKQHWHSLGMFGTYKINKFDKPLIGTFLFILSFLVSFLMVYLGQLVLFVLVLLFVPFMSALYRAYQYRLGLMQIIQLVFLYFIYFLARSKALAEIAISEIVPSRNNPI